MIISIREALFAGEEVDAWEPPKSDWILAHKPDTEKWEDDMAAIKNIKDNRYGAESVHFKRIFYLEYSGLVHLYVSGPDSAATPGTGWMFYYNEKYDSLLVIAPGSENLMKDEEATQKAMAYIAECLETGERVNKNVKDL